MKRIGIGPILGFIFFLVPLLLLAYPQPPTGNTGAPGDGNCTSCHSGVSTGGSVAITFPSGANYTPGVTQHLSVTVNDSLHSAWSFQVTARLGSSTSTQAGSFTATDTVNTIVQASGTIQDIETTSSGINQSTWNFDWTPPSSNVGNVNFYVTGLAAGSPGGATSGNGIYNASYVLSPPVVTLPSLGLSPTSLSFTAQQGGAAPSSQSISVTSGGTPVPYTVATSGGTWLTATVTSGTTPGAFSISANPSGLTAGTYTGTVTVTSTGVSNSPQTVPVTLNVTAAAAPTLSTNPSSLSFAYQSGGTVPAAQIISVSSSGTALNFTAAASGGTWLNATPTSGTTPGSVSVSVNPTALAAGTYTGSVTITSTGAMGSPQTIPVTLTVSAPTVNTLSASPTSLSFAYQTGGATPAAQSVSVKSSGTALSYTASVSGGTWLTATPTSGTTPGSVSVSVNPSGLAVGTFSGSVTVTSTGATGSPLTIPVTLTITAPATNTLSASPTSLSFAYQTGGATPAAQTISVKSSGTALNYTASASGGNWLTATPTSGTTPGSVSVSVNPTGLAAGTFGGTVTITSAGAASSPQTIAVTLVISAGGGTSSLTVMPSALHFSSQSSSEDDSRTSQKLTITSAGSVNVTYTAAATTQSGAHWLILGSTQGTTPGTLNVSVSSAGLASGTYNGTITITPSGSSSTPQSVPVTLVVGNPTTASHLVAYPRRLSFSDPVGGATSSKNIRVTSNGAPLTFSATTFGGSWLTVSPTTGTTPATLTVSADPHGLARGTYSGVITLGTGTMKTSVPIRLYVASSSGDDGGSDGSGSDDVLSAVPVVNDPTGSGAVGATWLDAAGVPVSKSTTGGVISSGLALSKTTNAPAGTFAGALIVPAETLSTLTSLGFDVRQGTHCTANSPHFVVVTSDDVSHVVTGCSNGTTQTAPAAGWIRVTFDPANLAQTNPVIAPGQQIKSISIVLDEGPEASPNVGGGLTVLDNITVNGTVVNED